MRQVPRYNQRQQIVIEQHNIREQEWLTHPSEAEATPEIGSITLSSGFHEVMEYTTQTNPVENEIHNEVRSDTDFSSGSDELYAPPESEYDTDVQADDFAGSVVEQLKMA